MASGADVPGIDALAEGVAAFAQTFDQTRGGFGGAPKFPRPSELLFLLRETARTGDYTPAFMVAKTLTSMSLGGMRDHVGGGFHRYSVDANWRIPHFEKMLYDQAQLVLALVETHQLAGDPFFAEVAEDTLEYVLREMTNSEGAFFSAEDADSVPPEVSGDPHAHKMEGAFYLWTQEELEKLLADDFEIVRRRFGIRPDGNAPEDPQGEFTGKNHLYVLELARRDCRSVGQDPRRGGVVFGTGADDAFPCTAGSTASSSRRQSSDRLERPDAGGLRTRIARAAVRGPTIALSRCGAPIGAVSRAPHVGRQAVRY